MTKWIVMCAVAVVSLGLADLQAAGEAGGQQQTQQTEPAKAERVNINTADAETLQTLPGIGPATAKSIIDYREAHEGFEKIEDLMNVKGVGEKTFLKLKDLITVGPPKRLQA